MDNLKRDEAQARAALIAAVSYDVELDVREAGEVFRSRTTVSFECTEPGASTFIDLAARTVDSVRLNGVELADAVVDNRIELPNLAGTNILEVDARCAYQTTGVGLHRFTDLADGNVYLHTQFEPFDAHQVFACFDQPDLKGTFRFMVDAPAGSTVLSNAHAIAGATAPGPASRDETAQQTAYQQDSDEPVRWVFAPTLPIPSYITVLVVGPYHCERRTHAGIDLGLYCRASLAPYLDPDEMFTVTAQGFDFFTDMFRFPYPFGKYDQVFVPEFNWGAMENPGCVTFSESYVFRSKVTEAAREQRANTTLHEMAHMWFGDLVTMRWWDDLWLNESFATYMATHGLAAVTRFTSAWATFADTDKAWAIAQDQLPSTHPISADIVDTDAVRTHFDGITYAKGASVLRQLVAWVGQDAFFSGLRRYFRRHAFANATLTDFLRVLEEASGRDLRAWAERWLQTAGVSTLSIAFADADMLDGAAVIQRTSPEHPVLRDHRVGLGLYDVVAGDVKHREFVELEVTDERTEIPDLRGPRPDLLLVNHGDLAFVKVRLDDRSVSTLSEHLSQLADPLARSVAWGALWDMTRDAELPAATFVDTVARHAASESDIGVLETLLSRASAAYQRYAPKDNQADARARLRQAAIAGIAAAGPGSDEQLVWVRCRAGCASDETEFAWLRGLLDGSVTHPGLNVDTELRWTLLTALAENDQADEGLIAAEYERDRTDMGARRAATARAACPTPEAKRWAWNAVLQDASLPLATRRALMAGLFRFGQDALLDSYIDAYAEALPSFWDSRQIEESLDLTEGLYPRTIIDDRVVAMADRLLHGQLPDPARRVVAERQDATKRALRARAADASSG